MNRALSMLMRLKAWRLDQDRRVLAEAVAEVDRASDDERHLAAEVTREQAHAAAAPLEAGLAYGAYAAQVRQRELALRAALAEARTREAEARQALSEAFLESKRIEILAQNEERRQQEDARAREVQEIEEIAVSRFLNRSDGGTGR